MQLGEARSRNAPELDRTLLLYSRFAEFSPAWLASFLASLDERLTSPATLDVIGHADGALPRTPSLTWLRVVARGYVERQRLPDLLVRATVAVYPYEDNLTNRAKQSVKLLELMAAGCPIVASDVGDIRRIGASGVDISASTGAADFAARVAALLANEPRRADLSAAARARAWNFTIDRLVERLELAYKAAGAGI
jgi:glycosyltransferase involved in cell wall biosynthesis